jgi:protein-tyrosine phosphatase
MALADCSRHVLPTIEAACHGVPMQVAARRGVKLTSRSRPLQPSDLTFFDLIVGMDDANIKAIRRAAEHWKNNHPVPSSYGEKLVKMTDFIQNDKFKRFNEVPDPYYGGPAGFELVLDLLEDACNGLLKDLQR